MFRPEDRDWFIWFTGLCDGEASFSYQTKWLGQRLNPKFSICLQEDDSMIYDIQRRLGFGIVSRFTPKAQRVGGVCYAPRAEFSVKSRADLPRLCAVFDAFPLHSKKQAEFQAWKSLVAHYVANAPFITLLQAALDVASVHGRISGNSQVFRTRATQFLHQTPNQALQPTAGRSDV
jgi:hypothetical protein